jgi:hypothetical protein
MYRWRRPARPASPAQRFIELDERDEVCADRLRLVQLGAEQGSLGVQHLEVGGDAAAVAQVASSNTLRSACTRRAWALRCSPNLR